MKAKHIVFSLIPLIIILGTAEFILRVTDIAHGKYFSVPLPEETAGLIEADKVLFWRMRKNVSIVHNGALVRTNRYGLRGENFDLRKQHNEVRILMIGESTTFGARVPYSKTYSAVLESLLSKHFTNKKVRVINAGVSAYSSFQSVMFLKKKGLRFQPDIVVLYSEANDYLPTSLRNAGNTEIGTSMTDFQLYNSKINYVNNLLMKYWKFYEFLRYQYYRYRIDAMLEGKTENPLLNIGMPDIVLSPRLMKVKGDETRVVDDKRLPQRVSLDERRKNLLEFVNICNNNSINFIIIHPSYAESRRHSCVLTDFCKANDIPYIEAFDILNRKNGLFLDSFHPNSEGHRLLAEAIYDFIIKAETSSLPRPEAAPKGAMNDEPVFSVVNYQ